MRAPRVVVLLALLACACRELPDGVVDRVEGGTAVVLTAGGRVVEVPARGLREGDVVVDGRVDRAAGARRRRAVALRRAGLGRDDRGEDLGL